MNPLTGSRADLVRELRRLADAKREESRDESTFPSEWHFLRGYAAGVEQARWMVENWTDNTVLDPNDPNWRKIGQQISQLLGKDLGEHSEKPGT